MITWTENGEPWKEEFRYSYVTIDGDVITPELYQRGGRAWFCASHGSMPDPSEVDKGVAYVRTRWRDDPILPENNKSHKVWYSPHAGRVPRVDLLPALTSDIINEVYRAWYCGSEVRR